MGTNTIYRYLLPEAVCCCLKACNFCFDELLSWYIIVWSFVVRESTISKLEVLTNIYCLRLFVVVYKLVNSASINSYHSTSVYQVLLVEDQPQVIYGHKHHIYPVCCCSVSMNSYHGTSVYQVWLLEVQP